MFRCYGEGRLEDGIRLLVGPPPQTLPWRAELAYLLACLQGAAGRPGEALATLRSALDAGGWWDPAVLEGEEDFTEVRRLPGFPALLAESAGRWSDSWLTCRDHDVLVWPQRLPARGALLALHGAQESEQDPLRAWSCALDAGLAVLAVRSSWRTSPRYRTWPRGPHALEEVDAAMAGYADAVAGLPLAVAGFSAGGRVALQWALSRRSGEVAAVIAVAPAIRVEELPRSAHVPGRIHLVVGAQDDLVEQVREVAARLAGCRLHVVEGAGHQVPAEAVRRLLGALELR